MNVVAIIQARMGSSRLPGKVLLPLAGRPTIAHVVERTSLIPGVSEILVATTTSEVDEPLAEWCEQAHVPCFRGSEEDVLDRYYQAAVSCRADAILRITADCPLLDPRESAKVLDALLRRGVDRVSNGNPPSLPDGLDTEAITVDALARCWREATRPSEREHVTLYSLNHPEKFNMFNVVHDPDLSDLRLTLDEEADYRLLDEIFRRLQERNEFGYLEEVLALLHEDPDLLTLNAGIQRNEGLARSLAREAQRAKT